MNNVSAINDNTGIQVGDSIRVIKDSSNKLLNKCGEVVKINKNHYYPVQVLMSTNKVCFFTDSEIEISDKQEKNKASNAMPCNAMPINMVGSGLSNLIPLIIDKFDTAQK